MTNTILSPNNKDSKQWQKLEIDGCMHHKLAISDTDKLFQLRCKFFLGEISFYREDSNRAISIEEISLGRLHRFVGLNMALIICRMSVEILLMQVFSSIAGSSELVCWLGVLLFVKLALLEDM